MIGRKEYESILPLRLICNPDKSDIEEFYHMPVKKKEHGSLTGSKRYAAEKGKTIEEQTQENHGKAMDKVKASTARRK